MSPVSFPDWPRCPSCAAVAYPGFGASHRPGCPDTNTDPSDWSKP